MVQIAYLNFTPITQRFIQLPFHNLKDTMKVLHKYSFDNSSAFALARSQDIQRVMDNHT